MFAPEDQQIEICLLKNNLEEIEKELVAQVSGKLIEFRKNK